MIIMLYSVENRKRGTKSCNKLSLPWQQLWRMRKRARDNESPHRVQLSHLPSLPPTLHQFAYLLAGTHIREMQSSLPPAAAVHNEWSLSQCAAASSRCYTAPAIAFLYIGTLFRRFSMRAVKGPARPYSVNQEESAAPRHGAPLTQPRPGHLPPMEESRERYPRHADSAWTGRKYDRYIGFSLKPQPFLTPFLPSRDSISPCLLFSFSLSRSRSTIPFALQAYLRSRKQNSKCTVETHLQDPPKSNSRAVEWIPCNGLGSRMTLPRRLDFVGLDAELFA